jgi:hypothetical protein
MRVLESETAGDFDWSMKKIVSNVPCADKTTERRTQNRYWQSLAGQTFR